MADSNSLTYDQLIADVRQNRFPSSMTGLAQKWLAVAYQDVWEAAPWSFKRVSMETLYLTADGTSTGTVTAQPLMPAAFAEAHRLYDDNGVPLLQIDMDDFEDTYASITATGRPETFTVSGRQIIVGPTPDSAYQFKVSYRRRLAHKDASGNVIAGFFTAGSDYPLWDDHHRVLVPRAQALGLKEINDYWSWPTLQDEFQAQLATMKRDYVERVTPRQWPAYRP